MDGLLSLFPFSWFFAKHLSLSMGGGKEEGKKKKKLATSHDYFVNSTTTKNKNKQLSGKQEQSNELSGETI